MSQRPRNQNRMKTTRMNAMKQSPDSLPPLTLSNPELGSLNTSSLNMGLNSNTLPDELKTGQPMDLNQLLKNVTSTSDESESTEEKPGKRPDRFTRLEEGITEQLVMVGMTVCAFHQEDGMVILNRASPLSQKIVALARQNPAVYKALKKYLEGSAYLNLAGELATISLALLANHGINPVGALIDKLKGKKADGDAELQSVA